MSLRRTCSLQPAPCSSDAHYMHIPPRVHTILPTALHAAHAARTIPPHAPHPDAAPLDFSPHRHEFPRTADDLTRTGGNLTRTATVSRSPAAIRRAPAAIWRAPACFGAHRRRIRPAPAGNYSAPAASAAAAPEIGTHRRHYDAHRPQICAHRETQHVRLRELATRVCMRARRVAGAKALVRNEFCVGGDF